MSEDKLLDIEWIEVHRQDIQDIYTAFLNDVMALSVEGHNHIITSIDTDNSELSTAIDTNPGSREPYEVELPHVLRLIAAKMAAGVKLPLVLRTFHADEISHRAPNGYPIPVKSVRGWLFDGELMCPLDEQQMCAAECTDHATGELLVPEEGVRYASAWPVPSIHAVPDN
jgi:hypothetical protein